MTPHEKRAQELMNPVLDVFGGSDGGVAFSRIYHTTIPQMVQLAESGDTNAQAFMKMVEQFSRLCSLTLKGTI